MKHTILTRLTTGALAAALAISLVGCGTGNQTPSCLVRTGHGIHHRHHRPQDPDPIVLRGRPVRFSPDPHGGAQ